MLRFFLSFAVCSILAVVPFSTGVSQGAAAAHQLPARVQRISGDINSSSRVTLPNTRPLRALPANDIGALPASTRLQGMTLVFTRSDQQEQALQALLAAQQDPSSPQYHQWLTPAQFGASFGMADADIEKAEAWLQQQGFSVDGVSHSRDRITFSGSVTQVASAFGTEIHRFTADGETHFAPAGDLSLPSLLAAVVRTVSNLSDFRPHPHVIPKPPVTAKPDFTSSQTGNHFLSPKDVATIYDINAAYSAGYTGSGQSIAVAGQTAIVTTDITNFQTAAGLTTSVPTLLLVPNTGTSTVYTGDELESDLDVEYSGGIAKGATIYFVYTGSSSNYGVLDAMVYAVDNNTAPIVSVSYGQCEPGLSSSSFNTYNGVLAQAAAQGQSVIVSSGDSGSTDCYGVSGLSTAVQEALAVDFPGDSQYVTAMGGTEFPAADVASTNTTYWAAASGSDVIGSALSYIPEQVWNDDSTSSGISSGGGGTSTLVPRPSWQTGVPGIPAGSFRLMPDISLSSSPADAGYLYCSSDTATKVTGSCTNGFRDVNNTNLTVAGGTSFAAPVFAGMLAIIKQVKSPNVGLGVANNTLYALAANSATYASAFHDIASGSNACTAGSSYCSTAGASEWPATTGYDEATGLGSVDLYNLLNAWPAVVTTPTFSINATTALNLSSVSGATVTDAISVASLNSFSGTLALTCAVKTASGSAAGTCSLSPVSVTLTSGGTGASTLTITNSASNSTGTLTVTVTGTSGTTVVTSSTITVMVTGPSFTLTPAVSALSFTSGTTSGNTDSLSLASVNGFAGTIALSCSLSTSSATFQPTCAISPASVTLAANGTVTATLTIGSTTARSAAQGSGTLASRDWSLEGGATLAMLLFCTPLRKRSKALGGVAVTTLLALGMGMLSGCSSSSVGSVPTMQSSAGSYTATVTASGVGSGGTTASTVTTAISITIN